MFTPNHFIWLGACALLIIIATIVSVKKKWSSRTVTIIFGVICALSETAKDMLSMIPSEFGGRILDPIDIPLHMCSLVVFAILIALVTKNDELRGKLISAVTVIGLIAPELAMLIPTEGVSFAKAQCYQYFIYHAALLWFALHHAITGQADLGKRTYVRNISALSVLIFIMLYIDSAMSVYGVNYFFLRKPPVDGLPILNLDNGWHCYFVTLLVIAYGAVTLVQLPFMLREKRGKKSGGDNAETNCVN